MSDEEKPKQYEPPTGATTEMTIQLHGQPRRVAFQPDGSLLPPTDVRQFYEAAL
ncbi:MAG: hypothetical protein ACYCW6_02830 [Candidatus Xenobia bacterium]